MLHKNHDDPKRKDALKNKMMWHNPNHPCYLCLKVAMNEVSQLGESTLFFFIRTKFIRTSKLKLSLKLRTFES